MWRTLPALLTLSNPITIPGPSFWIWPSVTCPEPFKIFAVNLGIECSSPKGSCRAYLSQQKSLWFISINSWAGSESRGMALAVTACFLYCSFYTPIRFLPTILSKLNCLKLQGNISERWGTVRYPIFIEKKKKSMWLGYLCAICVILNDPLNQARLFCNAFPHFYLFSVEHFGCPFWCKWEDDMGF